MYGTVKVLDPSSFVSDDNEQALGPSLYNSELDLGDVYNLFPQIMHIL